MAYAPYTNDRRAIDQGPVQGCFDNSETGAVFEYATRAPSNGDWAADCPHIVFMSDGSPRYATVKKTVAYIVVDEADNGHPVAERWPIKRHRQYAKAH